ncbi:extracellular serine-rich protein [Metarhizium album ARSEF 1941]|uniref:Extracellular serine-rich protein n=1 Tax=Metarhizium album (strain ARSEF 1941) TaxID=1081103 RepID=A0A0B2X373_METAS|nr:extracellular serine-rich protein [Metarhizium album ARSEF 1941]KHO00764.1 extracellular serine-rich protein [Metarhizium album ARSEF 1941]
MRFSSFVAGLALAASPMAAQKAKLIKVEVGSHGKLAFSPSNLEASPGTKIEFLYFPRNHSVTQSSFNDPCHPLEDGFFSGFVPTTDSPSRTTFTIEVKDTKPIWFYCGQANHCQKGMIGAINAPKTGHTFEAFSALAMRASNSTSPRSDPVGGVLGNGGSQDNSSSTAQATAVISEPYTPTWTSKGQTFTSTAAATVVAGGEATSQTTWAYTTKLYTSTWTSNGQTFTTTATTTLVTTAAVGAGSAATTSPSKGTAAGGTTRRLNICHAGALAAAIAAIL